MSYSISDFKTAGETLRVNELKLGSKHLLLKL